MDLLQGYRHFTRTKMRPYKFSDELLLQLLAGVNRGLIEAIYVFVRKCKLAFVDFMLNCTTFVRTCKLHNVCSIQGLQ